MDIYPLHGLLILLVIQELFFKNNEPEEQTIKL
jgi:hypothetical protein